MEFITEIATTIVAQMQKPTLAFLIGGMMLAALGSKFEVPEPVYKFIVILLLLKVGLSAGISVREANLMELAVPAILAAVVGIVIILIGRATLARWRGVSEMDGMATAGLFGAVSASTLAAGWRCWTVRASPMRASSGRFTRSWTSPPLSRPSCWPG
jgi:hypothetical protein